MPTTPSAARCSLILSLFETAGMSAVSTLAHRRGCFIGLTLEGGDASLCQPHRSRRSLGGWIAGSGKRRRHFRLVDRVAILVEFGFALQPIDRNFECNDAARHGA